MADLSFKLESFEGPLDLLLHLIRANKVNICDIPISEIAQQYMEYLDKMKSMDLEIASSFLVMAAELLYIKSKLLLPLEKDDDGEVIDPRQELIDKLLEYQQYKDLAVFLKERESIGAFTFVKETSPLRDIKPDNSFLSLTALDLYNAFQDVLDRAERKLPPPKDSFVGIVAREKVSVSDKIVEILDRLHANNNKIEFNEAFKSAGTRPQIVAVFLALLELLKINRITAEIKKGKIYFCCKGE